MGFAFFPRVRPTARFFMTQSGSGLQIPGTN